MTEQIRITDDLWLDAQQLDDLAGALAPLIAARFAVDVLDEDPPVAPEALRQIRETAGITREELSAHSGISFTTIGRIERGNSLPTRGTLRLIARALGELGAR